MKSPRRFRESRVRTLSQPLLAWTLAPCKFRSSRSSRLQFELSLSKWQIKFNSSRRTAVNDGVLFINTKRSCQPLRMTRAPNESPSIVRSPFFRPQKKSFFRIPLDKGPNESRLVQTRSDSFRRQLWIRAGRFVWGFKIFRINLPI